MANPKATIKDCALSLTFPMHACADAKQKLPEKLGT